jgi:hypothetical protein
MISLALFLKDLALVTIFLMRRYIEGAQSVSLRPKTELIIKKEPKLDRQSIKSMRYLLENPIEEYNKNGDTQLHEKIKSSQCIEESVALNPHQMFMINKNGQTPLDLCIDLDSSETVDRTGFVDETNDGIDVLANAITKAKTP